MIQITIIDDTNHQINGTIKYSKKNLYFQIKNQHEIHLYAGAIKTCLFRTKPIPEILKELVSYEI
jgi:hypothetical protein